MGILTAILGFVIAHQTELITVAGIVVAAITHAKITGNTATDTATAGSLIATVQSFLASYITTANVNLTVADLQVELKGQVAVLLAKLGIYTTSSMYTLIQAGVSAAISDAVNQFVQAHPTPKTLVVSAAHVPTPINLKATKAAT